VAVLVNLETTPVQLHAKPFASADPTGRRNSSYFSSALKPTGKEFTLSDGIDTTTAHQLLDSVRPRLAEIDSEDSGNECHKHPADRRAEQDLLDQAVYTGGSFSSRHRLYDTGGDEHSVIVVADRILDETGVVVGTRGYYVDITEALEESRRDVLDEALPRVIEARAEIEQAKGALRLVYGISDEQAFTVLRWRSQETNTKLRALAAQLLSEFESLSPESGSLRAQFDHLILSVHERIPPTTTPPERPGRQRTATP
jgi:hypothetical protein